MIVTNAGIDSGYVLRKIEEAKTADYGYDALGLDFGSMFKKGIVDPAKVVRSAIENAASVAIMVITTEALVTDIPEKKENLPQAGMPGMEGY